jgi:hypothetical protein
LSQPALPGEAVVAVAARVSRLASAAAHEAEAARALAPASEQADGAAEAPASPQPEPRSGEVERASPLRSVAAAVAADWSAARRLVLRQREVCELPAPLQDYRADAAQHSAARPESAAGRRAFQRARPGPCAQRLRAEVLRRLEQRPPSASANQNVRSAEAEAEAAARRIRAGAAARK